MNAGFCLGSEGLCAFTGSGPQHVLHGMFMEVLPAESGGQTSTGYPEVRIVDDAQMYLIVRASFSKNISGIKELLLCAFEGCLGLKYSLVKGEAKVHLRC